MCEWGDHVPVEVLIHPSHSGRGVPFRKVVGIDRCIAPIVSALQAAGIDMLGSCCGHGQRPGEIILVDGRRLEIHSSLSQPSNIKESIPHHDR